ncbi:MAG TPA: cupin domain-containing protein [Solirubrobacteraceae bacterium]|jgi:quercetin dioxygenase-like cupin family protein|nr:cupin domain-containing protein [Solirubrobacteraceae bacterium]
MTMEMPAGITRERESCDGRQWNIFGSDYRPVAEAESCFAFVTDDPPGAEVPPHVHPGQDEFIHVLEGRYELLLDGAPVTAKPGDLVRLPRGGSHGYANRTQERARALFWVSPAGRLAALFEALDGLTDMERAVALAAEHGVEFLPPAG